MPEKQPPIDRLPMGVMAVCHCVLNPAAKVVSFHQQEYEEERALREQALKALRENGVGLVQLPCPEFTMYGALRWGHVKEQFDNPFFRAHCRKLLAPIVAQLLEYTAHPERFHLFGVLGVDGSPSCGVKKTCTGDWGGELYCAGQTQRPLNPAREAKGQGVLIEELMALLQEHDLSLPILSLQEVTPDFLKRF